MLYRITIFLAFCGVVVHVNAGCNLCSPYGIACVSETEFVLCSGTNMIETTKYPCETGTVCTDLGVICAPTEGSSISPVCSNKCSVCEVGKTWTCTSKTTFAMCSGDQVSGIVGTCPDNLYCDTTGASICVDQCAIQSFECDHDAISGTTTPAPTEAPTQAPTEAPTEATTQPTQPPTETPTEAPTPTPTTTTTTTTTTEAPAQTAEQVCAAYNTAGRFPYDNDNACIKYVYCRYSGTALVAVANTCPSGSYFNKNTQVCDSVKPSWCV